MNHCHFSILYNELPFLKQKLPFLYEHFQQIIFYDLNIRTCGFSDDGSHEFIKNYPDPENKITLIEKTDLSDVTNYNGYSSVEKRKMFAVGSSYVNDDIDFFWCTDMDEFFFPSMIDTVEEEYAKDDSLMVFNSKHYIYWKTPDILLVRNNTTTPEAYTLFPRIVRHKKGTVYGHCNLGTYGKQHFMNNEFIYHFAFIGDDRMKHKWYNCYYATRKHLADRYYNSFKDFDVDSMEDSVLYGYPRMYPNPDMKGGVLRYNTELPIDGDKLMKDMNNDTDI